MGKLREGMKAAINGFVTVTMAMPCLPTLPFVHFQTSDLQSILCLNPPHGSTQGLRGGFGEAITTARFRSRQSSTWFDCWILGLESPHAKGGRYIKSGELYPKGFSLSPACKGTWGVWFHYRGRREESHCQSLEVLKFSQ